MTIAREDVIVEAVVVAIYTGILSLPLSLFSIDDPALFFFLLGFVKHGLGSFLGLHSLYCRRKLGPTWFSNGSYLQILLESVGEGLLFILFGNLYSRLGGRIMSAFMIGLSLHLLFELFSFHSLFLKYRCST
uniref:Uncharacterized protein n=1 Tax=viral metagenome TaxID=1070528 RepID=A0A6C0I554_9ZZZZ